jgi:hypothetical protein
VYGKKKYTVIIYKDMPTRSTGGHSLYRVSRYARQPLLVVENNMSWYTHYTKLQGNLNVIHLTSRNQLPQYHHVLTVLPEKWVSLHSS